MNAVVEGHCDSAFGSVRGAFAGNFAVRGGAVAVWHKGRLAADLWGGRSDVARTATTGQVSSATSPTTRGRAGRTRATAR